MIFTIPDIAYAVHKLSQYLSAPTLQHLLARKKGIMYLQATVTYGFYLQQEGTPEVTTLIGYSEVEWACDINDKKSNNAPTLITFLVAILVF